MWLVLCDEGDQAAEWAAAGLAQRGLVPSEVVTAPALAAGSRWVHRVSNRGVAASVQLRDGRSIDSAHTRGSLNRLSTAWSADVMFSAPADRTYAIHEFGAFIVSWLACLPGPAVNRVSPRGLAGPKRADAVWRALAARAGLPLRNSEDLDSDAPGFRQWVIAFDGDLYGDPVPAGIGAACRRLAAASDTNLLGIGFTRAPDDTPRYLTATATPDLRLGGAPLLDALARYLTTDGQVAR
jgi:hypothetical protein